MTPAWPSVVTSREEEAPSPPDTGKKVYVASETLRMVQELDAGADNEGEISPSKRGPMPAPFNPLKSYQTEQPASQKSPTYRPSPDTSPGYSSPYKTPEKSKEPAYSPTYKPSTDVNANTRSPTYKPDFEPKSFAAPTQSSVYKNPDVADTLVQSRATITVPPRVKQDSAVKDLPAFRNQSPRPFQRPQE